MDKERRAQLARDLQRNELLPELLEHLRQQQVDIFLSGADTGAVQKAQLKAQLVTELAIEIRRILDEDAVDRHLQDDGR